MADITCRACTAKAPSQLDGVLLCTDCRRDPDATWAWVERLRQTAVDVAFEAQLRLSVEENRRLRELIHARRAARAAGSDAMAAFAAGWLTGNEHYLWEIIQTCEEINGGFGWYTVDAGTVATLRTYAEQLGGWIYWDRELMGERFIALDDWRPRHTAWQAEQERQRQAWASRQQG